jgi:hypothetical protein
MRAISQKCQMIAAAEGALKNSATMFLDVNGQNKTGATLEVAPVH